MVGSFVWHLCFFEQLLLADEYFSWWYVQHMLPYGTGTSHRGRGDFMFYSSFLFNTLDYQSLAGHLGCLSWVKLQQTQEHTSAYWVFLCFCNPPNYYMDYRILNVRMWSSYAGVVGHTDSESAPHFWLRKKPLWSLFWVLLAGFELGSWNVKSDALPIEPPCRPIFHPMLTPDV